MVIQNTYPNLSNIVHTDFELGRVIQTMTAADPGITVTFFESMLREHATIESTNGMSILNSK